MAVSDNAACHILSEALTNYQSIDKNRGYHARNTSSPCSNSKEISPPMTMRDATTFLTSSPSARCSGMFSYEADARIARHRNGFSWRSCLKDTSGGTTTNGKCGVSLVLNVLRYLSAVSTSRKCRSMISSGAASSDNDVLRALFSRPARSALSSLIFDSRAAILLDDRLDMNRPCYHKKLAHRSL